MIRLLSRLHYVRYNSTKNYASDLVDTLLELDPTNTQQPLKLLLSKQLQHDTNTRTSSTQTSSVPELNYQEAKTIQAFIKSQQTDQCLRYIGDLGYPKQMSDSSILDNLLKLMLKQGRIDESFYFIHSFYRWDFKKAKIVIQQLTNSQQSFLILPFAYSLNLHLKLPDLIEYAWLKLSKDRKQKFGDGQSEAWWMVNNGLVRLSLSQQYDNVNYSRLMNGFLKRRGFPHWKTMIGVKDKWNKVEDKFVRNYLWQGLPRFNMSRNSDDMIYIASLFNLDFNGVEKSTKVMKYLEHGKVEAALSIIEPLISSQDGLNEEECMILRQNLKIQAIPFIKYYVRRFDLLGLIEFINSLEKKASLHIRYEALSHYAIEIMDDLRANRGLIDKLDNGGPIEVSIRTVVGFLYQETYSNGKIWTYSNLKNLNRELSLNLVLPIDYSPSKKLTSEDKLMYAMQTLHHQKVF